MKKRFKKIYVEITNRCNLNCSFCGNNNRKKESMNIDQFKIVLDKIKNYTDYIYLHIKGEPLIHENLEEIIALCNKKGLNVNITTNGTLIKNNIELLKNVRQVNVSLHSENNDENYLDDVINSCREISKEAYISYRLWTLNDYDLDEKSMKIIEKLIEKYKLSPEIVNKIKKEKSIKIDINTYVDKNNLFTWPDENDVKNDRGYCYGLNTHIGILVDGTIIPCCLDGEGVISLGNIFTDDLENVLNSKRVLDMIEGFKNRSAVEELCKSCTFKNRF